MRYEMKPTNILLISLLLVSSVAKSGAINGNDLLHKLTNKNADGFYYIVGFIDAAALSHSVFKFNVMRLNENSKNDALRTIGKVWGCRPKKASYGQVTDITIAYLKKHPEIRHQESYLLVADAMKEAWPCK